jgi:hypothetical protein
MTAGISAGKESNAMKTVTKNAIRRFIRKLRLTDFSDGCQWLWQRGELFSGFF